MAGGGANAPAPDAGADGGGNAAFFSGLKLIAHTPHSFWITRYPKGREATVSWGGPELIFQNDWDAPVVILTHTDSSGITVRMLSAPLGRKVVGVGSVGTYCGILLLMAFLLACVVALILYLTERYVIARQVPEMEPVLLPETLYEALYDDKGDPEEPPKEEKRVES